MHCNSSLGIFHHIVAKSEPHIHYIHWLCTLPDWLYEFWRCLRLRHSTQLDRLWKDWTSQPEICKALLFCVTELHIHTLALNFFLKLPQGKPPPPPPFICWRISEGWSGKRLGTVCGLSHMECLRVILVSVECDGNSTGMCERLALLWTFFSKQLIQADYSVLNEAYISIIHCLYVEEIFNWTLTFFRWIKITNTAGHHHFCLQWIIRCNGWKTCQETRDHEPTCKHILRHMITEILPLKRRLYVFHLASPSVNMKSQKDKKEFKWNLVQRWAPGHETTEQWLAFSEIPFQNYRVKDSITNSKGLQWHTSVKLKFMMIVKISWDVKKWDDDFLLVSLKLIQILLFMPDSASQLHMTRWKLGKNLILL